MKFFIVPLIAAALFASCTGTPNFSDVREKEWKLIEVYIDNELYANFNRDTLVNEGFAEIFTLTFDSESVSGVGAPNRYSAPYTLGSGQAISIALMRSTLMASIHEPEKVREHDFFNYIQNVYEWKLEDGKLSLLSKTEESGEVRLVFSL